MISPSDVKRVRALHQKKFREEEKRFLVQGRKVVGELLASNVRTEVVFASEQAAAHIGVTAKAARVPVEIAAPHQLERIGTLEKGNELVALAIQPDVPPFIAPRDNELMLALDDIHDPRNMGGLLRIADWFGVTRVVCSPDCIEIYNPKVVQSSMGSIFRVPVRYAPLAEELSACTKAGARVYLASMDGVSVFETKLVRPSVLVLGSESHGLSAQLRALDADVLSIPRVGRAESLNVAMAAAALCAEFTRQRT